MTGYENRQKWDYGSWPEFDEGVIALQGLVMMSPPGPETNLMVFTVASLASGCRHCQAHGSVGLHHVAQVPVDKIQALWDFEGATVFDDRERAALRFATAAGATPNAVTPDHHAELRAHFTDEEIRTLLGVVGLSGLMNRFNDSLAVVTDRFASDWAAEHLAAVGWSPGKHVGADHERRADPPFGG